MIFCTVKRKKYPTYVLKGKTSFSFYSSKKSRGTTSKNTVIFIVWIVFIPLEQKINLNCIKKYVKTEIL